MEINLEGQDPIPNFYKDNETSKFNIGGNTPATFGRGRLHDSKFMPINISTRLNKKIKY